MASPKSVTLFGTVLIGVFSLLVAGCGSSNQQQVAELDSDEFEGAPCWVVRGCECDDISDSQKKICGVGSASGTRNHSLARSTAIGRARTEIARSLDLRVKAMLKDYQATTTGGEEYGLSAADEQHVADVSKQITDITLSGTQQEDLWVSPNGSLYALVTLDVDKFKSAVAEMGQLSEEIRQAVQQRADDAFLELDEATGN